MKPLESLKIDINKALKAFENLCKDELIEEKSSLIRITKKFIFLKTIYNSPHIDSNKYYYCLLEDTLFSLQEIEKNNPRYFYLNLRSILENALRMLNSPNPNTRSFNANKEKLENIYKATHTPTKYKSILNGIYNKQYSKACSYVHGNLERISFRNEIDFIYSKFETSYDPVSYLEMLSDLEDVLHGIIWIMLPIYYEIIDSAFKDKNYIVFLINKKYKQDLVQFNK
ncbi:hypothetical protein [Streptococcus acidominimus]|uniref:Uncharacterized protein n=1 Tax=Streptococcus acidominimus TaxID=1326 RepID=A0A1Q8EFQ0_STRAI|nr:hypothetical protein [Streptococcus acidominimus]OLF50622.1 hypothetical protein BU200_00950 [Streptococcus acidominimus]QBX13642.1 hypothetical protein Javan1_0002 [Streptococcus phage Javan1]SUN05248.1 Uncharacterised protein [Streptococcus acidominimus]SUN41214.1 Uncharacterised protein [Streptococcus acidominimus]